MSRYWTTAEVAAELHVTARTVQRWCRDRTIGHIRTPGGRIRFTPEQVEQARDAYLVEQAEYHPEVFAPNPRHRSTSQVIPMRRRRPA